MGSKRTGVHFLIVGISIILYISCLFFDSFQIAGVEKPFAPSYEMFQVGWIAVLSGMLAWLANPLLYISWFFALLDKDKVTLITSMVAMALALSFMLHDTIVVKKTGETVATAAIVGYGLGYWLWLASAVFMALGSIVILLRNR
jgi:hypothetical protein